MCKTISQKVRFRAEPSDVYRLLVTADDRVGGRFRMGDGTGIVVDLAPAERVVRAWREADYPDGVFSMAAVTLRRVETGTELRLTHRGVPKDLIPRTEERWRRNYWEPMKQELQGHRAPVAEPENRAIRPPTTRRLPKSADRPSRGTLRQQPI